MDASPNPDLEFEIRASTSAVPAAERAQLLAAPAWPAWQLSG